MSGLQVQFRVDSPGHHTQLQISVEGKRKLSREKVMDILKDKNIRLDSIETSTDIDEFVGKDKYTIHIVPITATEYLETVEKLVPVHRSWFQQLAEGFVKFVKWMFHIKSKAKISEMELAFAMHLFRNADTELFEKLTGSSSDALSEFQQMKMPMSQVLDIWLHFFEESNPYLSGEEQKTLKDFVPALTDLRDFQKELETLRENSSKSERIKGRIKLQSMMVEKAQQAFESGKPFYMPGGYIDPTSGESAQMIYELTQSETGQTTMRVIDLSENFSLETETSTEIADVFSMISSGSDGARIAPSVKGEVDDLSEFLEKALRAQVGPPHALYQKKMSKWDAIKFLIRGNQTDEENEDRKELMKSLSSSELETGDDPVTVKKKGIIEPSKLMEVFFKTTKPELYHGKKTLLKFSSFLSLYRQIGSRMKNDPKVRQWMRGNAESLLLQLEKKKDGTSPIGMEKADSARAEKDLSYMRRELKGILDNIDSLDQRQKTKVPKSPGKQSSTRTSFRESLHTPGLAKGSSFQAVSTQVVAVDPLQNVELTNLEQANVRAGIFSSYKEGLKAIQKQVDKKKWDNAAVLIEDLSRLLDELDETDFISQITAEEAEQWSGLVRDFGLISAQVSYGLGYIVPTPAFIQYNLQSLAMADKLIRAHDPTKIFSSYRFDTAPIEQVLRDPYLSLGSRGPAIEKALSYLQSPPKAHVFAYPIRLTNAEGITSPCYFYDLDYFYPELEASLGIDQRNLYKMVSDDDPIPSQLAHMRQLYLTTQTLLAPSRTYIAQGVGNLLGAGLHILEEVQIGGLLTGKANPEERLYRNSVKQVIKKIQNERGSLKFHVKNSWFGYGRQFVIEPYGLALQDFDDPIFIYQIGGPNRFDFAHPRLYKDNGEHVDDEQVQSTLFEQAVAVSDYDLVSDEGERAYTDNQLEARVIFQSHGVYGKTQLAIMREKLTLMGLPSDLIQELQLMHTGDATRAKETIGKFCKHIGLLNGGNAAPILQRLFDTGLFRNNQLMHTLKKDPAYAQTLFESLRDAVEGQKGAHQYRSYLHALDMMEKIANFLDVVEGSLVIESDITKIQAAKESMQSYLKMAQQEIEGFTDRADLGTKPYATYQREFHRHQLLAQAHQFERSQTIDEQELGKVLKSYCLLQSLPRSDSDNPDQDERIAYFMHRIGPEIRIALSDPSKRSPLCNHVMHFLYPDVTQDFDWKSKGKSGFLFKAGDYTIDLKKGVFWEKGVRKCSLPKGVLKHPDFEKIETVIKESGFEDDLGSILTELRSVKGSNESGSRFEFQLIKDGKKTAFRLIVTDDNILRFYKKVGSSWYQLQTEIVPPGTSEKSKLEQAKSMILGKKNPDRFPRELESHTCWIKDDGRVLRAEKKGELVYLGKMKGSPPRITSLKHKPSGQEVVNPWSKKSFDIFKRLDDPAQVLARGKNGRASEIYYNRFNLSYHWDPTRKAWTSPQHPGYHLSTRTLREYFTCDFDPETSVAPYDLSELREVFSGSFDQYQLLEADNGWPKVVLSGAELTRMDPEKNPFVLHLQKSSKQLHQRFDVDKKAQIPLFTYTADPNHGLVCDDVPDGYLYLAYTLFAQGKYKEAVRYLKRADINRPLSPLGNEILGWIQTFQDKSMGAQAFKMHVTLMLIHQAEMIKGKSKTSQSAQAFGLIVASQMKQYLQLVDQGKIPKEWQLDSSDLAEFRRYGEKSIHYIGFKLAENKDSFIKLQPELAEISSQLESIKDPSKRIEQKLTLLNELKDKLIALDADEDFQKVASLLFTELHMSVHELYQWYETGILQKLLAEDADHKAILDELVAYEVEHHVRLTGSLKSEIFDLEQVLQNRVSSLAAKDEAPKTALKEPIPLFSIELDRYFDPQDIAESDAKDWGALHEGFKKAVTGLEDLYGKELGTELAEDLAYDLRREGVDLSSSESAEETKDSERFSCKADSIENLLDEVKESQQKSLKKARQHKLALVQKLTKQPKPGSEWSSFMEQLQERGKTWQEAMVDTALRCAGEDDWSVFRSLYSSDEEFNEAVAELQELCRHYLKESITTQQLGNAKNLIYQLKAMEVGSKDYQRKSHELYNLMDGGWRYNPDTDPDALSFLLIEYELGFICRPSQVDVIRASIDKIQFKQEICGGGKTTVLRNVIAHIRADGTTLSAVSTLEPLRREHGLLFSRTTAHAFGQKSIDFVFNRQSPSNEASLLKIHRNLLKMIVERGRVDLTKGDLLSFKLEMILKQEKLAKLMTQEGVEGQVAALNAELDVMENIRDLLKAHAVINADELDKDCDATQEKIYAHGERVSFNEQKVDAALELMEAMLTAESGAMQTLGIALRNNQQTNLPKEEIDKARQELAEVMFNQYCDELKLSDEDKNTFIAYLTELKTLGVEDEGDFQATVREFYNTKIKPSSDDQNFNIKAKICFMHEFLTQIAPHALTKKGGVNFGRSDDLVHVIPFAGSDIPKQGSEHGLEGEQIWYGLMDYIDLTRGGVSSRQISQLVQNFKKRAISEVDRSRKLDPENPKKFQETNAAREFADAFEEPLDSVTEIDFDIISEKINRNPHLLLSFVKEWVFPEYQRSSENIVSDSQDPPSMVKAYGGSSGTDYSKYSMPDAVDISNVRQPGVHGQIVRSLIEIDEDLKHDSFLTYAMEPVVNWKPDILESDFSNLKPGDEIYNLQEVFNEYLPRDEKPPPIFTIAKKIAAQNPSVKVVFYTSIGPIVLNSLVGGDEEPISIALTPPEGKTPGIIETLAKQIKGGDCISDVGVAFPGIPAVQIARQLSRKRPELTIRFMTRNDEWKMFKDGKVIPVDREISLDQVFTIFDDTHTRGSERPSMEGVTEYVTIDTDSSWAAFEQGVLRERGVTKGHAKVKYLISPALMKKWGGEPSLDKLFGLLVTNEAEKLKPINLKAEKQKIKAITRHGIEQAERDISEEARKRGSTVHHKVRAIIHEATRQYFVRSTQATAETAGAPSGTKSGGKSLDDLTLDELEKVQQLIEKDGPLMSKANDEGGETKAMLVAFCQHLEEHVIPKLKAKQSTEVGEAGHAPRIDDRLIPSIVSAKEGDLDNEQSVEQEQEQEQEMAVAQEQEQETSVQGREEREEVPHIPLELQSYSWRLVEKLITNGKEIGGLKEKVHRMRDYVTHLPEGKFFTENFSPVVREEGRGVQPWTVTSVGGSLPPDQSRVSRTLIVINTKTGEVGELIPSLKDNDIDIEEYVRMNQKSAADEGVLFSIYNYDTDRVDGGAAWEDLDPEVARKLNEQIVSTKFFNGQVSFGEFDEGDDPTSKEILLNQYGALVNWIAYSETKIDDLERSFRKFVRQHRISYTFEGSDIHRAFVDARRLRATL